MLNFFLNVLDKYGMDTVQIGVIVFFGWKIAQNHLKHIQDKLNEVCGIVKKFEQELGLIKERIAKVEGKLE